MEIEGPGIFSTSRLLDERLKACHVMKIKQSHGNCEMLFPSIASSVIKIFG